MYFSKVRKEVKNIIFIVQGGFGKTIASTAVVRAIKKNFPDKRIIVVCGYPDVFLHNPNVYRVFNFNNTQYFYDDYINESSFVIKIEPYLGYDYLTGNKHLIETWCDMLGIECDGLEPDLFLVEQELESARIYVDKITNNGKKPLVLLQWIGGKIPKAKNKQDLTDALASMYRRSLKQEVVQEVVNYLHKKGFTIGDVGHPNFPDLKNTKRIFFNPSRMTLALIPYCHSFIGIDSFLQHASSTKQLNKKGIVCWGGTNPKKLGYEKNINLKKIACNNPFCHRPNTYVFDTQPNGVLWLCPYGEKCLKYTSQEIINEFEKNFMNEKKRIKK